MNSYLNKSCYDNHAPCDHNYCEPNQDHPKPGRLLLSANSGSLSPTILNFVPNGPIPIRSIPVNQTIASVTIDTSCFRQANLLVDFAGILTGTPNNAPATFTYRFRLIRTCRDSGIANPLRSFIFSHQINQANFPDSQTLKFEYTSCDLGCEDCCEYSLELTNVSITNVPDEILTPLSLTVSVYGTISVLVVESVD